MFCKKKKKVAKERRFQKIKELCSNRRMRGEAGGGVDLSN